MSTLQANKYNRKAAAPDSRGDEIVQSLKLKNGEAVADIGSGGGHFSFEFAQCVGPAGRVFAVDKDKKLLDSVIEEARARGLDNIEASLYFNGELCLPEGEIDLIFLRNVFHHIGDSVSYFSVMKRFLKPGGRLAIIDYRKRDGFNFHSLFGHYTPEERILQNMQEAGFERLASFLFLPTQSFNVFTRCSDDK